MRAVRAVALALAAAVAAPRPPALPDGGPPAAGELKARVDAYLAPLVDADLFSGAVLLARGGKVLVEAGYGMADPAAGIPNAPDTRFKIMSVSKALASVAAGTLVREGRVDLEGPVGRYLAPWPEGWREVRVGQLLDHTSGIPDLESEWAPAARQERGGGLALWRRRGPGFAARALDAPPGTRFRYSNFNYVLLGLVVEAVDGRPFAEALRGRVLAPAGMERTGVDDGRRRPGLAVGHFRGRGGALLPASPDHDMSGIQAAGGILSTVGDLWRLDRALGGDALLDAATRRRMETPSRANPGYALGWEVSPVAGRPCVHHSGAANAYVADFLRFPGEDACVVVASNLAFAPAGRVSRALASLLFGGPVRGTARATPEGLAARGGLYRPEGASGRALLVRPSGSTLVAFDVDEGAARARGRLLVPLEGGGFGDGWSEAETLDFGPGAGGRCSSAIPRPGTAAWERRDPPAEAWAGAEGAYRDGAGAAGEARILAREGRLLLEGPAGRTGPRDLVPLSATLALALPDDEAGILVRLERDAGGRPVRIVLEDPPGRAFVGVKEGASPDPLVGAGEGADFEVLVLAAIHAPWQFRSARFTPAHVRAALEAARPDVVAIECPPEWFARGRYHEVTWEAEGVAVPFARARGIPVVPVDWQDLPEREEREAGAERERSVRLRTLLDGGRPLPLAEFGFQPAGTTEALRASFRNPGFDFDLVNGIAPDGTARPAPAEPEDPAGPGSGDRRDREIAARCLRAMAGRPGKRLVVVIGAAHKGPLDALLARVPGVRVLRLGRDVPAPSPEAVDRAWTAEDLLAVLGHNLDGERSFFHPDLVDLPRMRGILERLEALPGTEDAAAYFGVRLLAAEAASEPDPATRAGRLEECERTLAALAARGPSGSPYPFPMGHWRMRYSFSQAVRLERARLLLGRGRGAEARALLEAVARERAGEETATRVEEDLLRDPGFEAGAPAPSPMQGWYASGPEGAWRTAPDEAVKVQGLRSLRMDLLGAVDDGRLQVGQVLGIPAPLRGKAWDFSVRLRGEGGARAFLIAYRWEDGGRKAVEVGRGERIAPGGAWSRASLRVPLAADAATVGVRCCFSGPAGARLWLDDASPLRAEVEETPSAGILAREFPRTLLAPVR